MTTLGVKLRKRAADVGVELDAGQLAAFARYGAELALAAEQFNLTAIPVDRYTEDHFIDSLTLVQTGKIGPGDRCGDIGAGAGFPGLPVKIATSDIYLLLIESNRKKADFLRGVVDRLGLMGADIYEGRAEEAGRDDDLRGSMDVVVARAVASLPVLLEYAMPLLRVGGWFLAMKGPGVDREMEAAADAAAALGARIEPVFAPTGIEPGRRRFIVAAQKTEQTDRAFPRKTGIPAKRPLGGRP